MDTEEISDRQKIRQELDWIRDLNQKDVGRILRAPNMRGVDSSARIIYEDCGIETNILLWRKCLGITLYISDRPVNELRKLFIRQFIAVNDLANSVRNLALTLGCSESFVRMALAEDPKSDPRQEKLFKENSNVS